MKFGRTNHPEQVDFTLPEDHLGTQAVLERSNGGGQPKLHVGLAKWKKPDLEGFYPPGVKDELAYYSSQFNAIEMNATFYRVFPSSVFAGWRNRTPEDFTFFPKLHREISHEKRLRDVQQEVDEFLDNASGLGPKLGTMFLQMHEAFGPRPAQNTRTLVEFIRNWPAGLPLAVELRHTDWFNDAGIADELYALFEEYGISNVITDVPARRDLLHMRLTTPSAFIRYGGSGHESNHPRLDAWVDRLACWSKRGIREFAFFFHETRKAESALLSRYFVEQLNDRMQGELHVPVVSQPRQVSLF